MTSEANELLRRALSLSPEERAMLASSLIDSLDEDSDPDVEQAWKEEVSRRIEQLESGEVGTIPWEDLHLRLAAKLGDAK